MPPGFKRFTAKAETAPDGGGAIILFSLSCSSFTRKQEQPMKGKKGAFENEVLQDGKQSLREDNWATMRAKISEFEHCSNETHLKKKIQGFSGGPSHVGEEINTQENKECRFIPA